MSISSPGTEAVARSEGCKASLLLVDDHPLVRRGLRLLIELDSFFEVCAEADDAPAAIAAVRRYAPKLAIVDVSLKTTNGIELTKILHAEAPELGILVVSMHDERVYAERALRAGAMGYLMKDELDHKVIDALQRISGGEIYVSNGLKDRMVDRFLARTPDRLTSIAESLSDRELEVLTLLGTGFGTREIAQQLHLSVKTIDSYRDHLKTKLHLSNGGDLLRYAIKWNHSQKMLQ